MCGGGGTVLMITHDIFDYPFTSRTHDDACDFGVTVVYVALLMMTHAAVKSLVDHITSYPCIVASERYFLWGLGASSAQSFCVHR